MLEILASSGIFKHGNADADNDENDDGDSCHKVTLVQTNLEYNCRHGTGGERLATSMLSLSFNHIK